MELNCHAAFPGFTAGASLADRVGHYASQINTTPIPGAVRAQLWGRGPGGCIPDCVCVGPDACPCCTNIVPGWSRVAGSW
jgi:hypothetical protein